MKGESIPWIKRIRDDMRNEMERDLMAAGIPTILKPRGIGRALLERITDVLRVCQIQNFDKSMFNSSCLDSSSRIQYYST